MPPVVRYKIGIFEFVSGRGEIPVRQYRMERIVGGANFDPRYRRWEKGSEPFVVTTARDVTAVSDAVALAESYAGLVGGVSQELRWHGVNYTTAHNRKALVVAVEVIDIRSVIQWCGSFDDTQSKARLDCRWTLELRSTT